MVTQSLFEIPAEIREIATASVGQARAAFEKFIGAARSAVDQAAKSPVAVPASVQDINVKAMSCAEANVKAAFDHAEKLVQAKDGQEALKLQSEYLTAQLAALQEQAKEIGAAVQGAITPKSA